MRRSKDILRSLGILILIGHLSGCTVGGFLIGAKQDKRKSSTSYTLTSTELNQVEKGNFMDVHLIDGTTYRGRFNGFEEHPYNPNASLFLIEIKGKKHMSKISSAQIATIHVIAERKNSWLTGLGIGAVLDIIAVALISNTAEYRFRWSSGG